MFTIEETDNRFYVDQSTISEAGLGCFAKVPVKKNDYLEVIGPQVKIGSPADDCTHYAKRYKFLAADKNYKIVPMGFAAMVNHTNDKNKQNVELVCIPIPGRDKTVVYQALRDIEPGEELLGYYGDQINAEIEKTVASLGYVKQHKTDWQEFLSYDLYHLKCLEEAL